jgi:soluble lytic murein transglycosylase
MRILLQRLRPHYLAAALCAASGLAGSASAADSTEQLRELFRSTYDAAELGNWDAFETLTDAEQQALRAYVLWPDLRAAWLRANLKRVNPEEIEPFLQEFGALKPGRELRYHYALALAARGDLQSFHAIYGAYYQGLQIAKLDCLALQAELAQGRGGRLSQRALALWTVGKSQVDECDPVFAWLTDEELIGREDYLKRYALAIETRSFTLARWLGKSIDDAHVAMAGLWLDAQNNPADFLASHEKLPASATAAEQLAYAAERLAFRDPIEAQRLWTALQGKRTFSATGQQQTARHIALWTARDDLPGAHALLLAIPDAAVDDEVARWRARVSLRDEEWRALLDDIGVMSDAERRLDVWRYWQAIATQALGNTGEAQPHLESLARERSYYGFLAADELGLPYAFQSSELEVDELQLDSVAAQPAMLRARELYYTGLESRGRAEWDTAIAVLTRDEKRQAAILANRWGWHSRAIATAADIGAYDDLDLRYPMPYLDSFERYTSSTGIPLTWAYGIARSESLFMRDIRSSAGAIGLMQIMPATGSYVARQLKVTYSGIDTLTDPATNIQLGTAYLQQMAARFGGNRILATAAYNAGPARVDQWIPEKDPVDARVWIENIPFNETRNYVQRVIAAESIFYWRLTGETRRLSDELAAIEPSRGAQRLASVSR